jgi:hypothetical protein
MNLRAGKRTLPSIKRIEENGLFAEDPMIVGFLSSWKRGRNLARELRPSGIGVPLSTVGRRLLERLIFV